MFSATVSRPPYSPDLALSDFWLFGYIKTSLVSRVFNDPKKLLEAVIGVLNEIRPTELQFVFTTRSNE
jgi:hypothetical protein